MAFSTADRLFRSLDRIEYGRIDLVTPDGRTRSFEGHKPGPVAHMQLHDWSVVSNLAARGDLAFAEDYQAGQWETDDLTSLMFFALQNGNAIEKYLHGSKLLQIGARLQYLMRRNSKNGSRRNISFHYDLGNEFYALWLDRTMTYSSGIFETGQENLEDAQNLKYDRIIDRLHGTSGDLLEIGCGWGGFGDRASARTGHRVRGLTLSHEQHRFAANRLRDRADIVLEDYRDQHGTFDNIVSIEMFEAVGERYWSTYFKKIASLLRAGGTAMIQTITIDEKHFDRYRRGSDMIRSFIFPGGMLPSPTRFAQEAQKAGLAVTDRYRFGQDYATTLERWLHNFDANAAAVRAQGFSEEFIRLWRFYLAACIAGFRTGRTDVMQIELRHA